MTLRSQIQDWKRLSPVPCFVIEDGFFADAYITPVRRLLQNCTRLGESCNFQLEFIHRKFISTCCCVLML